MGDLALTEEKMEMGHHEIDLLWNPGRAIRGLWRQTLAGKTLIVLVFVSQDDPYMFRKPETRCSYIAIVAECKLAESQGLGGRSCSFISTDVRNWSLLSAVVVNVCRLCSSVLFSEESLYWQGEGYDRVGVDADVSKG